MKNLVLKQNNYFKELFSNKSNIPVEKCNLIKVEKDTKIINALDEIEFVWVLVEGKVKALEEFTTGEIYIFQKFSNPEVFGEMEILAGISKFKVSIITETDCSFITIPVNYYLQFIKEHSEFLFKRTQSIMKRVLDEEKNNRIYLMLNSIDRLKMYFVDHYELQSKDSLCQIKYTRQQISDETGYSVKTINRGIKKLLDEDYITIIGQKIFINYKQYRSMLKDINKKLYQL